MMEYWSNTRKEKQKLKQGSTESTFLMELILGGWNLSHQDTSCNGMGEAINCVSSVVLIN